MGAEFCMEVGGERAFVAGGEIGFDVPDFAHAGNDGADVRIVQDEAQRQFRKRRSAGDERL